MRPPDFEQQPAEERSFLSRERRCCRRGELVAIATHRVEEMERRLYDLPSVLLLGLPSPDAFEVDASELDVLLVSSFLLVLLLDFASALSCTAVAILLGEIARILCDSVRLAALIGLRLFRLAFFVVKPDECVGRQVLSEAPLERFPSAVPSHDTKDEVDADGLVPRFDRIEPRGPCGVVKGKRHESEAAESGQCRGERRMKEEAFEEEGDKEREPVAGYKGEGVRSRSRV